MPLDIPAAPLVRRHLEAAAATLERDAAQGRYNTLCIRGLASAATLLGEQAVANRAVGLLRGAPDESFWAGEIGNIEFDEAVAERLRRIGSPAELEKRHPPYDRERILKFIRSCSRRDKHIACCLEGRLQDARRRAGSGLPLEEVALTLAVLGDFESALSVARDPALENFRQSNVMLVLVIEFFRSGRLDEFQSLLAELESEGLDAWTRMTLALGFGDREPWGGYPYPDW
jgi:hypothetical protein